MFNDQLVFAVDLNTCIKCKTCEMSCNEYYNLTSENRRKVISFTNDNSDFPINISISCTHCLNPVCVYVCPQNNFQKRRDGIVVLEANDCNGCQKCIKACPINAPKLNKETNRVDKCNFCFERISDGLRPICIENCVTGALGMMVVSRTELKENLKKLNILPIANFVEPALYVVENKKRQLEKREG